MNIWLENILPLSTIYTGHLVTIYSSKRRISYLHLLVCAVFIFLRSYSPNPILVNNLITSIGFFLTNFSFNLCFLLFKIVIKNSLQTVKYTHCPKLTIKDQLQRRRHSLITDKSKKKHFYIHNRFVMKLQQDWCTSICNLSPSSLILTILFGLLYPLWRVSTQINCNFEDSLRFEGIFCTLIYYNVASLS